MPDFGQIRQYHILAGREILKIPDKRLIEVARGMQPADLIFSNARIVNVFTGEIEKSSIAVFKGKIAGIGDYTDAEKTIDLQGRFLIPGLIDGHVHLESSLLDAGQYAKAVVPHGTLSIVTDLHEIANVSGLKGIDYILGMARKLPLDLFLMAPSCVPATGMETSGAFLGPDEIRALLRMKECIGLGEVMNFPGVLFGDPPLLLKLRHAHRKIIDGHAPGLGGKDLNAYIGAGISSDHESVRPDEAREKLRRGMHLMIREGSSEKNLEALLPMVNDETYKRCFFVIDDRSCYDLLHDGDMDAVIRKAVKLGLAPVRAVQMATINTAEYFRLDGLGAIAPGYFANLVVTEDLTNFQAQAVYHRGKLVAERGQALFPAVKSHAREIYSTVKIKLSYEDKLALRSTGMPEPVIEIVSGQIITKKRLEAMEATDGEIIPDLARDIIKLAVIERHHMTGNAGIGLVKGFGLKKGALASTVAHDSHNIVAAGTNNEDILAAIKEIDRLQGGLVVAAEGKILGSLPLPVAGLLSDQPLEEVAEQLGKLEKLAAGLGCVLPSPFATLSFLALPVIPELRLTDLGMFDVSEFKLIERG
jgi:adenine deaminase